MFTDKVQGPAYIAPAGLQLRTEPLRKYRDGAPGLEDLELYSYIETHACTLPPKDNAVYTKGVVLPEPLPSLLMGLWVAGAGTSGRSRVLAIQKNLKIAVLSGINCNICLEIYIVPIDLFVGISSSSSLTHKSYSI